MLHLIGYDLSTKGAWTALSDAVTGLPDTVSHRVPGGPWLLKSPQSLEDILLAVGGPVATALPLRGSPLPTRKLLGLTLAQDGEPLLGAHRGFDATAAWLSSERFSLTDHGWHSPRVLYITFGLHDASAEDFRELGTAIWHRFHGCCRPLHSDWLVHTSLPPGEVCRYLETFLPKNGAGAAELLVLHPRGPAVESGCEQIRTDVGWLWENGIDVKHRRII